MNDTRHPGATPTVPPTDLTESTTLGPPPAERLRRVADRWTAAFAARERTLWLLVVLALLADVTSTAAGIQAGLAEGNPLVAGILGSVGVAGFLAFKGAVLAFVVSLRLAFPQYRVAIPLGLALPWLAAATANAALLLAMI